MGAAAVVLGGVVILLAALIAWTAPSPLQPTPPAGSSGAGDPEQGRYLARAGNCHACHSLEDGEALAGGVAFDTPFGTVYSSNITPHPTAGIGGWSEQAFVRSLREGVSASGKHLYPVFPYPAYARVSEEDIRHIFAYLQTVPPSDHRPPRNALRFPFDQRALLGVWKLMFLDRDGPTGEPGGTALDRGAYLVEGLGHCGACHTPRNALGAEIADRALSGGVVTGTVEGTERREWTAVSLSPSWPGLASCSEDELVEYLATGYSMSRAVAFGPMTEVIFHSTRHLTQADLRAIARFLKQRGADPGQRSPQSPDPETITLGALIYDARCGTCHLPTGLGDPELAPPLDGSAIAQADNPATLINLIVYGGKPSSATALERPATLRDDFEYMPALGSELDPEEISIVATYVRNAWGNRADPVTVEQVERQY